MPAYTLSPGRSIMPNMENGFLDVGGLAASQLFVLNRNSKTVATNVANPGELEFSTAAAEDNLSIVPVAGARYLEMYHLYTGTTAPTAQPVLNVYGRVSLAGTLNAARLSPGDVDSANFDNLNSYWLPLEDADSVGTYDITFTGQPVIQNRTTIATPATFVRLANISTPAAAVKTFSMTNPRRVIVAGHEAVMAAVKTAGTGAYTKGLVVARLIW